MMKAKLFLMYWLLAGILTGSITKSFSQELSAKAIIQKSEEKARGTTCQSEMTMTIVRPGWERSISMKTWSKGTDYSLVYITAPAKEKGQVFMKRQKDMWNWVPSIERLIKIPPSMMMQSWMGSDFTNDDLVKESSIVVDYTHKLVGKETIRDQECYKIELIPMPEAAVTWGKIVAWVTVSGFDQWKIDYFDEDMELVSEMNASNIKHMGDRDIPTHLEMIPMNKDGNKTVLETTSIVFNQPIADNFFSQQNMKSIRE
jgi:hypothetical protein